MVTCLPLQSLPCIWNILAKTTYGSDSLGEMRCHNSGNQGGLLLTKMDEPCEASGHLLYALNCVSPFTRTLSPTQTPLCLSTLTWLVCQP